MAFIIWLSVLGLVLLIALAPITLRAAFDRRTGWVELRIYGIPYTIAPPKKAKTCESGRAQIRKNFKKGDKSR